MRQLKLASLAVGLALLAAPLAGPAHPVGGRLKGTRIAEGLDTPTSLVSPPGDRDRIFVLEQPGRIRLILRGKLLAKPFMDIHSRVLYEGERGLLGLAFHPDYAHNGRFFIQYNDVGGDTQISEFHRIDGEHGDPGSERKILFQKKPFGNHNGGQLAFGPDGMLYIGLGDGGGGGDPYRNAQNLHTLLGKLLRIDIEGKPYRIPPDNPFVGHKGARGEIWAYGLRNPWRFSFDRKTRDLYIGDVGQNKWEEVDVLPAGQKGLNFGWNIREGSHCFEAATCRSEGLTMPVLDYALYANGCAIIGGYVYRGKKIPWLQGNYFHSDYCGAYVHSFRVVNSKATDKIDWTWMLYPGAGSPFKSVTSMGEDADGELYIVEQGGRITRIDPA